MKRNWRQYTKLLREVAQAIPTKQDTWFGAGLKILSLIDTLHEEWMSDVPAIQVAKKLCGEREILAHDSRLVTAALYFFNVFQDLPYEKMLASKDIEIRRYERNGEYLCVGVSVNWEGLKQADPYMSCFWHTPGYPLETLFDKLWSQYPNGIMVDWNGERGLHFSGLPPLKHELSPEGKTTLQKLTQIKARRTFLAIGTYGMGKTTLMQHLARHEDRKCLKFSVEAMSCCEAPVFKLCVDLLRPGFIIVDDFDRLPTHRSERTAMLLQFMEELRQPGKPSLGITVNSVANLDAALLRAGRIDQLIRIDPPEEQERLWFLTKYTAASTIPVLPELVKSTEGFTIAELINLCENTKHFDAEEALAHTNALRSLLKETSGGSQEEPARVVEGIITRDRINSQDEVDRKNYLQIRARSGARPWKKPRR